MKTELHNKQLRVEICTKGAELTSLISQRAGMQSQEWVWQKEQPHWQRQSPVLFPIVGRLRNDCYTHGGATYTMKQHGFARDQEFEVEHSDTQATFRLRANDQTRAQYPFEFELTIEYRLEHNILHVGYCIENTGTTPLPFSIGAHPAFKCPFEGEDATFGDYYLEFAHASRHSTRDLNQTNGLFRGSRTPCLDGQRILPLNYALFANDALVFDDLGDNSLWIRSNKSRKAIQLNTHGFPYLGLWTQADAPFLCIEPWDGLADGETHNGSLLDKEGITILAPHQFHRQEWSVQVHP